jgi:SpoVK/Ycf46/Vps4 family AAA+-type ATPase
MIALGSKCILFQTNSGEAVPLSAEMISVKLSEQSPGFLDQEYVDNAAEAVFHYFKHDLEREAVTMAEFSEALEIALKGLNTEAALPPAVLTSEERVAESDLVKLALECGEGCELVFFPKLRTQLRDLLKQSPRRLQFSGIKECVKALTGARRWNPECNSLKAQIISFLRGCLLAEQAEGNLSLVVK